MQDSIFYANFAFVLPWIYLYCLQPLEKMLKDNLFQ